MESKILNQGKTKIIHQSDPGFVLIENKDDITKNDDSSLTKVMSNKAVYATTTTCAIFSLLQKAGIPVAFKKRISETTFLATECKMIGLEVIARRYADGSYLQRFPNLRRLSGETPHRFHRLVFELFLKTSGGVIKDKEGKAIGNLPNDCLELGKKEPKEKPIDDPFIPNKDYSDNLWHLSHPKIPIWDERSHINLGDWAMITSKDILPEGVTVGMIEDLTRRTFLVLEGAWAQLGCRLIDFKIEFGVGPDGELLVADVIDNDSWRLRTNDWQELSKQLFRDNAEMEDIKDKYALVANLVGKFKIPKQAIVTWRGSEKDEVPNIPMVGIDGLDIIISGHKSPAKVLAKLKEIQADFPEGGVIIAIVGMSNGLGPILAARTTWPVIAVPASQKNRPHDVWSSLEVPSNVPLMTVLSLNNAALASFNILAQGNPIAYMYRQLAIEDLDAD